MACCAFAAFLLINLLAPFGFLRTRLFGDGAARNPAVAWRQGDPGTASGGQLTAASRWVRGRAAVGLIAALEMAMVIGVVLFLLAEGQTIPSAEDGWDALVALHTSWCGAGGIDSFVEPIIVER